MHLTCPDTYYDNPPTTPTLSTTNCPMYPASKRALLYYVVEIIVITYSVTSDLLVIPFIRGKQQKLQLKFFRFGLVTECGTIK